MIFAIRAQSSLPAVCALAAVLSVAIIFFLSDQSRLPLDSGAGIVRLSEDI